jgi:hypothetical protein
MGAVHGVHLKYAAMSALAATAAITWSRSSDATAEAESTSAVHSIMLAYLWYCSALHALITALFLLRRGEWILGKRHTSGIVPLWSYMVYAPFHLPTWLYTLVHHAVSNIPVASEVAPGWWIGGRYARQLGNRRWACTIDLTVEFTEGCRDTSDTYLLLPCWDGVPPSPKGIERAARLAAEASLRGDIMVHCAHGRGRSTCVMVACLVKAGLFSRWEDAYEECRKRRKGVKLNGKMRRALDDWAAAFG